MKNKNCGMKEFLRTKMKVCQIEVEVDSKWTKLSLMRAQVIIVPKIWINRQGEEKRFLKDFQLDLFRDYKYLSETATRIQMYGYLKTIPEIAQAYIIIHRWDQFPARNPVIYKARDAKRTFHIIADGLDLLHHVNLYRSQVETPQSFYENKNQKSIQLIQQDWSNCICVARGKQRLMVTKERKKSRGCSVESSWVRQMFQTLEQDKEKRITQTSVIIEEKMSDYESQRSRGQEKKLRDDKDVIASVCPSQVSNERLIDEIAEIERALTLAQIVENKGVYIMPKVIFPEGIVRFVEQCGAGNYLKLFLKLNYENLVSPTGIIGTYIKEIDCSSLSKL